MPRRFTTTQILIGCFVTLLIIASIFTISYFNPKSLNQSGSSKLKVVTSFYPLEFLAKEIGKDIIDVQNITPAGSEPHQYEPTQRQIIEIAQSDILLTNGAGLESWTNKILQSNNPPKKILELSKSFQLAQVEKEDQKIQDPHIWLSPKNYIKMAKLVSNSLQENQTPANQAIMTTNTQALIEKLEILDKNYQIKLSSSNCGKIKFVTNHAAFNYLAKDYGLELLSINGLSPESEPTTKELTNLADIMKSNNIKYVLTESVASPKLAQTLATEVGITTLELNPLEGLNESDINLGKNYITVMNDNLQNLAQALECK